MASRKIPNLEYWAQKYAMQYWGRPVTHPVVWYTKTVKYDGYVRHFGRDVVRIALHPRTIYKNGNWNFHKTLKHELCHYFLVIDGIDHSEHSHVFIEELKRVGGGLPYGVTARYWHCRKCEKFLFESAKFNWTLYDKYKCGCNANVYAKKQEGYFVTEGHHRKLKPYLAPK